MRPWPRVRIPAATESNSQGLCNTCPRVQMIARPRCRRAGVAQASRQETAANATVVVRLAGPGRRAVMAPCRCSWRRSTMAAQTMAGHAARAALLQQCPADHALGRVDHAGHECAHSTPAWTSIGGLVTVHPPTGRAVEALRATTRAPAPGWHFGCRWPADRSAGCPSRMTSSDLDGKSSELNENRRVARPRHLNPARATL